MAKMFMDGKIYFCVTFFLLSLQCSVYCKVLFRQPQIQSKLCFYSSTKDNYLETKFNDRNQVNDKIDGGLIEGFSFFIRYSIFQTSVFLTSFGENSCS